MILKELREQITDYGKRMSAAGLSIGTSGNLSILDPGTGYMAISPSGIGYFETTPEDVVVMTLRGEIVEGERKPSSEHALHAAIYQVRPDARAIVHTHSRYCTTFACLGEPLPPVHYAMASGGVREVPCAPYATFGTPELAAVTADAMRSSNAVLMANHGMCALGPDLPQAFALAENVEFVAELAWRARCIGTPRVLTGEQVEEAIKRFGSYGQK